MPATIRTQVQEEYSNKIKAYFDRIAASRKASDAYRKEQERILSDRERDISKRKEDVEYQLDKMSQMLRGIQRPSENEEETKEKEFKQTIIKQEDSKESVEQVKLSKLY